MNLKFKNKTMKKIISLILALSFFLATPNLTEGFTAKAAVSINATEVTIYGMDDWAEEFLTIPSGKTSFQIKVTGASSVSYRVYSGDSATVSSTGLIEPKYTTWYWQGNWASTAYNENATSVTKNLNTGDSVIRVTADGKTYDIKVHVNEYSREYADKVMDEYIAANIKSGMTGEEKLRLFCKFVADRNYSPYYSGYVGLIVAGGGDCWASTDTIIRFCEKVGIEAWVRNANMDGGAGSGHRNAMAYVDGKYYICEAGYSGTAPRGYYVSERTSLFSYRSSSKYDGIEIYQYDGYEAPSVFEIPAEIDGKTVVGVGENFFYRSNSDGVKEVIVPDTVKYFNKAAFNSMADLEKINIPDGLESIGNFVFTNCNKLTEIDAGNNKNYVVRDGVIYNSDMSTLLYAPAVSEFAIPESVKEIAQYAFYYNNNLKEICIPEKVTMIGEGAFGDCASLEKVDMVGAKTVSDFAFTACPKLTVVNIGEGTSELGAAVFRYDSALTGVEFPKSITAVDEQCFLYCSSLTDIYYSGTESEWKAISFDTNNDPVDSASVHYNSVYLKKNMPGDTDLNDTVDAVDLTILARHVAKIELITNSQGVINADVVKNSMLDANDLTALARHVAKIELLAG